MPPPEKPKLEKSPSLKETLNKINTINKPLVKSESSETETSIPEQNSFSKTSKSIDSESVLQYYQDYLNKLKTEHPRLFSALNAQKPVFANEKLELVFQNNAQLEDFKLRAKPGLLSYLKEKLETDAFDILENVAEVEKMEKPTLYSDQEKLSHMVEKNPALQKLKNKFKLDFD
ncbi:MAG: hypothetical protein JXA77_12230 [Bacteroidales bacterium]|nr:hypothetical protein [Bacteroidales bacterium]MBN2818558.1 hypothetical protein [Bacteroidales bacterium]